MHTTVGPSANEYFLCQWTTRLYQLKALFKSTFILQVNVNLRKHTKWMKNRICWNWVSENCVRNQGILFFYIPCRSGARCSDKSVLSNTWPGSPLIFYLVRQMISLLFRTSPFGKRCLRACSGNCLKKVWSLSEQLLRLRFFE